MVVEGVDTADGLGVDRELDRAVGKPAGDFTGEGMGEAWGETVGEGTLVPGAAGMGASGVGGI